MKGFRRIISSVAIFLMIIAMNLTAYASSGTADATPAVAEARKGIIQVRLYYVDDAGESFCLQTGSGFLIGASSGATNVITNDHVITLPDSTANENDWDKVRASEVFGVDFFNANEVTMEVRVAVKRDVEIVANYVNGSTQSDFAILELDQPIYDRTPLKIADSSKLVETQNIYALGFPSVTSVVEDDSVFTVEDVTISNGIIGKFQSINNIPFILHNAQLGQGNSGGPLVNSDGAVVGVNTLFYGDDSGNYYSSISINEIAGVLDALGISYEKAEGAAIVDPEPIPEPDPEPTPEPIPEPDPEPIPEPSPEVQKEGPNVLLIGGIAAAVLVVVIIVVIVVVTSSKKKASKKTSLPPVGAPIPPVGGAPVPPAGASVPKAGAPIPPVGAPVPPSFGPMDSGAGETSILGGGVGETSILGGGSMQPTATLIRKKNGESVNITKPLFTVGKERKKVDFCIPDNNSVSRTHADIVCKGNTYYIIDKNSTNYTFVNGNKLNPNQEVKLNSGDKIKLADEEFEIRL